MSYCVEIRRSDVQLVESMKEMRDWLDSKRCEPKRFQYFQSAVGLVIHVDFGVECEAVEFSEAFTGKFAATSAE